MIRTGLVSVTYRQLAPERIVKLSRSAGLQGIEWGGDVHVPHGDTQRATQVRALTEEAGLCVVSYGSYYRVGHQEPAPFELVLETARALGAPTVRVWAGKRGSAEADPAYRTGVAADTRQITDLAQQAGVGIAYEYHGNSLTDTSDSAVQLLQKVNHPALSTYWQELDGSDESQQLDGLRAILPWLSNVHLQARTSLSAYAAVWPDRLSVVRSTGRDHWALIEFVRDNAPEALQGEAETLRSWLTEARGGAG
jgi:sugar phosphate isomerase/epimerase